MGLTANLTAAPSVTNKEKQPAGRANEKGHVGMRPRMALWLAGVTSSDQLLMSPDLVVSTVILCFGCASGKGKRALRCENVPHIVEGCAACIALHRIVLAWRSF
jgi:hypothetical protein